MSLRKKFYPPRFILILSLLLGLGILLYALAALTTPAQAAPAPQAERPNDFCLACHQKSGVNFTLGSDKISVYINPTQFGMSIHAQEGYTCVKCHSDISDYPHPKVKAKTARAFSIVRFESCKECHEDQYLKAQDSMHQRAMDEGNENAAICTDCHNPHTQRRLTGKTSGKLTPSARLHVPQTCAQCHSTIYNAYKVSVHGNALTEEGNLDVPTCIDCHGVHNIGDPTTVSFRNSTPYLCAKCHTDAGIMDKYKISTKVLDTYVADFHGTTVKLFEEQFPGQPTNKPVCTDCHGVHNISKVNNPLTGIALRDNLVVKCQRCHPDVTANFSAAWMSHYEPSPEKFPIVYAVNLFYQFFIPAVLGGMIFFVLTDIYRRIVNRIKGGKHV
jgi:hypothetical protein